jgi:dolichol-phosphate mannosyltransferase
MDARTVPGWASTIISITFLGGVQLLSLGIIGEYISRIISNVRNRPLYVIDKSTLDDVKDEE